MRNMPNGLSYSVMKRGDRRTEDLYTETDDLQNNINKVIHPLQFRTSEKKWSVYGRKKIKVLKGRKLWTSAGGSDLSI